jgi:tetrahydromethanopterin S-methyltransferase subunit B
MVRENASGVVRATLYFVLLSCAFGMVWGVGLKAILALIISVLGMGAVVILLDKLLKGL